MSSWWGKDKRLHVETQDDTDQGSYMGSSNFVLVSDTGFEHPDIPAKIAVKSARPRALSDPLLSLLTVQDLTTESRKILDLHSFRKTCYMGGFVELFQFRDETSEDSYNAENMQVMRLHVGAGLILHMVGIMFQRNVLLHPEHPYDFAALGPELTTAFGQLENALQKYLFSQLFVCGALALTLCAAPLKWTHGCSVILAAMRIFWLFASMCACRVWPVPQWLVIFPSFWSNSQFCVNSTPYRHFLYLFPLMCMTWGILLAFLFYSKLCGPVFVIRFFVSVTATWALNVWVEDQKRRRFLLQRIYQAEYKRLSAILSDLLPTFEDADKAGAVGGGLPLMVDNVFSNDDVFSNRWLHHASHNMCHVRQAVVLQLDICDFTSFARQVSALDLAHVLHQLFGFFDTQVQQMKLFKMDTVGDAYIVAGWLPHLDVGHNDHPELRQAALENTAKICSKMVYLAGEMLDFLDSYTTTCGKQISARIGIGRGLVVVGALGSLQPRVHIRGPAMREAEQLERMTSAATLAVCDTVLCPLCGVDEVQLALPLGWKLLETVQHNSTCSTSQATNISEKPPFCVKDSTACNEKGSKADSARRGPWCSYTLKRDTQCSSSST